MPVATAAADPPLDPPAERSRVSGMVDRAERRILAGRAERELVHVRPADDDRPSLPEAASDRCVAFGDAPGEHARARRRDDASLVDDVLQGESGCREAVRGRCRARNSSSARPGGLARAVGVNSGERVRPGLVVGNCRQTGFDKVGGCS